MKTGPGTLTPVISGKAGSTQAGGNSYGQYITAARSRRFIRELHEWERRQTFGELARIYASFSPADRLNWKSYGSVNVETRPRTGSYTMNGINGFMSVSIERSNFGAFPINPPPPYAPEPNATDFQITAQATHPGPGQLYISVLDYGGPIPSWCVVYGTRARRSAAKYTHLKNYVILSTVTFAVAVSVNWYATWHNLFGDIPLGSHIWLAVKALNSDGVPNHPSFAHAQAL